MNFWSLQSIIHSANHKKKKGLIFLTTSFHILAEQLADFGIQDSAGKEKFSTYRRH